jgi:DNA-binding NarL/FixJ family response regulator
LLPLLVLAGGLDADVLHAAFDLNAQCIPKPVTAERIDQFIRQAKSPEPRIRVAVLLWGKRYGLSDAEADVLYRTAVGEGREAIARARGSSVLTVQRHASNLLRRTGDESLQTAVALGCCGSSSEEPAEVVGGTALARRSRCEWPTTLAVSFE